MGKAMGMGMSVGKGMGMGVGKGMGIGVSKVMGVAKVINECGSGHLCSVGT